MNYNLIMESEKTSKRSLKKIFRSVWLYSLILFVVGVIGFKFLGWETGLGRTITLIVMGISALIGGISFLTWISILIFSNKFSRILTIFLGIFISSVYALIAYSITYIFVYSRVSQDSIDTMIFLQYILPFIAFGVALFAWLKAKNIFVKAIVIVGLVSTYFMGRSYAVEAYKPLKQASILIEQAYSTEGQSWIKETDDKKYLEGEREFVALHKQASELIKNDIFRSQPRKYFSDLYQVNKTALDFDAQLITEKLKISQEEIDKNVAEITEKRDAVNAMRFSLPFWTDFFLVK